MIAQQAIAQCFGRQLLILRIHRRTHPQTASINAIWPFFSRFAKAFNQLTAHFFGKIAAVIFILLPLARYQAQGLCACFGQLRVGDPAIGPHFTQHPVTPRQRSISIFIAAIFFRCLWQSCQKGHFVQSQFISAFGEIGLRSRLHAKGLTAQRNFIHIKRQNLLLGQRAFNTIGKDRLFNLAGIAIFICQKQVFRDLLRNRRCTA